MGYWKLYIYKLIYFRNWFRRFKGNGFYFFFFVYILLPSEIFLQWDSFQPNQQRLGNNFKYIFRILLYTHVFNVSQHIWILMLLLGIVVGGYKEVCFFVRSNTENLKNVGNMLAWQGKWWRCFICFKGIDDGFSVGIYSL